MTLTQFNATRWGKGMYAEYRGDRLLIVQVDFEEALVGMLDPELLDGDKVPLRETMWARCENVTLLNPQQ